MATYDNKFLPLIESMDDAKLANDTAYWMEGVLDKIIGKIKFSTESRKEVVKDFYNFLKSKGYLEDYINENLFNLKSIAEKLNQEFNFPFQIIRKETNLGDCVYICISLDAKENWKHNIFENSRILKAHIFCTGQFEYGKQQRSFPLPPFKKEKYTFEFSLNYTQIKLQQKTTPVTGIEIYTHIVNQLKKLN